MTLLMNKFTSIVMDSWNLDEIHLDSNQSWGHDLVPFNLEAESNPKIAEDPN